MKKKLILSFILGGIIFSSITAYAVYKYQASDIGYTPENSEFKVDNVESAINELYKYTIKTTGATYVAPKEGETHKGIVYLDPTNLENTCDENNSVSTTETKIGCMKWYIYSEGDKSYALILDHNTTATQPWYWSNPGTVYENSPVKALVDKLILESGWDESLKPRILTAEEVNIITGKTVFDISGDDMWYYLDSKTHTQTANANNKSKYAWLFDYTNSCTSYGCNIADDSNYGYWTSTTFGSSPSYGWRINSDGRLYWDSGQNFVGIRPVITVSKKVIK